MRSLLRALLATIVVALAIAAPSGAILNGKPDTAHPYVGILVTVIDGQRVPVCSGFLVSPTVFVTAGHCVDALGGTLPAYVSFDQAFNASSSLLPGTPVPNPDFDPASSAHEIALIVLETPVTDRGYAQLPRAGLLSSIARSKALTIVGYGANGFLKGGGRPVPDFRLVRSFADVRLVKLEGAKSPFNLRMSSGACFGDSGGPVLLGSSHVVVGLNSFVKNRQCAGNAFAFRLDTAESLGFLAPYL
jgi:trypsin